MVLHRSRGPRRISFWTCSICNCEGDAETFARWDYDGDRICKVCRDKLARERQRRINSLPYYLQPETKDWKAEQKRRTVHHAHKVHV